MWFHRHFNETIPAPIGLISWSLLSRQSAPVVEVSRQTGQGRVGVGMAAVVCNQSNIEMLSQNRE